MEIHLVGLPVSEGRSGIRRFPEGAVKSGGVFNRVGHDGSSGVSRLIQGLPDGQHPSVHHVGGSHHVRSRLHMGKSGFCQQLQGFIIVHILAAEHPAVAVGGVFAHAHIGDVVQIRHLDLCPAQGFLHNTLLRVGSGAHLVLVVRNAEKHHAAHAGVRQLGKLLRQDIQGIPVLSRHGRDLLPFIFSLHNKQRIDQRGFVHSGLPHHSADLFVSPQAAGSDSHVHFSALLFYSLRRGAAGKSRIRPTLYLLSFSFITRSTTLSMVAFSAMAVFMPAASAAARVCRPMQAAVTLL